LQLCGLAILIAGALSYANIDKIDNHLKDVDVTGSPIALIVVGSIVFIVAFYGCCGAIRESHCMVVTVRNTILHNEYMYFNTMYAEKSTVFPREPNESIQGDRRPCNVFRKYIFLLGGGGGSG
jgi:hypothetical protein